MLFFTTTLAPDAEPVIAKVTFTRCVGVMVTVSVMLSSAPSRVILLAKIVSYPKAFASYSYMPAGSRYFPSTGVITSAFFLTVITAFSGMPSNVTFVRGSALKFFKRSQFSSD